MLAPGGNLLLAFQVGDEPLHLDRPFGHPVSLDFRRLRPARVSELAREAGLTVHARLLREAAEGLEQTPQAFLLARRGREARGCEAGEGQTLHPDSVAAASRE